MKNFILFLFLTLGSAQAMSCQENIGDHVERLERIVIAYEDGVIDEPMLDRLVYMNDKMVADSIDECQKKLSEFFPLRTTTQFWIAEKKRETIRGLKVQYKEVREELLHGTERVD